jgi:hypothetical protein
MGVHYHISFQPLISTHKPTFVRCHVYFKLLFQTLKLMVSSSVTLNSNLKLMAFLSQAWRSQSWQLHWLWWLRAGRLFFGAEYGASVGSFTALCWIAQRFWYKMKVSEQNGLFLIISTSERVRPGYSVEASSAEFSVSGPYCSRQDGLGEALIHNFTSNSSILFLSLSNDPCYCQGSAAYSLLPRGSGWSFSYFHFMWPGQAIPLPASI